MRDLSFFHVRLIHNVIFSVLLAVVLSACTVDQRLLPPPDPTAALPAAAQQSFPSCLSVLSHWETARVVSVTDGDTIVVEIDGRTEKLRYIGINTPEIYPEAEPYGLEAADENRRLVMGKTVDLYRDQSETDRFGRLLRYVVVDGVFINELLVREGLADARDYPPDTACSRELSKAEDAARLEQIGMWKK